MAKKQEADQSAFHQFKQDLKADTLGRLYFLHGEERYLQEHYMALLHKKVVSGPMEDFNFRRLTPEHFSVNELLDAVEALPMMADRTLVQVDDCDPFSLPEEERNKLAALFRDLQDTCCLVFYYDTVKFRRDGKMKKLAEAMDKNGQVVEFCKQSSGELAEWIARHFRAREKTIAPELCQYLIFLTGGDMTTLHSEIRKLAAYSRMPAISRLDIDTVVEPVLQAAVFDITDALAEGNYDLALRKLMDVLRNREDPIVIIAAIGSHFRRLLTAKTLSSYGQGADALMEALGSNSDYFCRKIMSQARKLQELFCCYAVEACYQADKQLKIGFGDGETIVQLLLLQLSQEASK